MSSEEKRKKIKEFEENHRITVGELKEYLNSLPDDMEITFGCTMDGVPLIFHRTKLRGGNLLQIELNEVREEIILL